MHDARVVLKDGTRICGPIWEWRPEEGYFTVVDSEGGPLITVQLDNCVSAVQCGTRISATQVNIDVDLLERARKERWNTIL
jgi:hypothetical protein